MNNPTGPWSLVRHLWARNFQQNPAGTVLGSLLAVGGIGLLLFFGFFVVMALVIVGGFFMLAQTLLGGPGRTVGTPSRPPTDGSVHKSNNNNALEGEYTIVTDKESDKT